MNRAIAVAIIAGIIPVLTASCGGGRSAPSPPRDAPAGTYADDGRSMHGTTPGDDLLLLTPSAASMEGSDIALAVDGLAISRAEYDAGLRQFIEEHPNLPEPQDIYRARLREELLLLAYVRDELALQEEEFRYRARAEFRETIAALVLERIVDSRVNVTDEELRARYNLDREMWVQTPRVVVELILVATHAEAQALLQRIDAGENFSELARTYSLHSSNERGGRLEPFRRGTYSAALEDVAFRLRPGETGTAETERGTFILRKIADSSESMTPYVEVREQIRETIRREKWLAERAAFLVELESRYPSQPIAPTPAAQ